MHSKKYHENKNKNRESAGKHMQTLTEINKQINKITVKNLKGFLHNNSTDLWSK